MPSIHDLVVAIRQRPGVRAVVVTGRDGLLIDTNADSVVDSEGVAAAIPDLLRSANRLADQSRIGGAKSALLEYTEGTAIVAALDHDAVLVILVDDFAAATGLIAEVQRNRSQISALFEQG